MAAWEGSDGNEQVRRPAKSEKSVPLFEEKAPMDSNR